MDIHSFHIHFGKKIIMAGIIVMILVSSFFIFSKEEVRVVITVPADGSVYIEELGTTEELNAGTNELFVNNGHYSLTFDINNYVPIQQTYHINKNPFEITPEFIYDTSIIKSDIPDFIGDATWRATTNAADLKLFTEPETSFLSEALPADVSLEHIEFSPNGQRGLGFYLGSATTSEYASYTILEIDFITQNIVTTDCANAVWLNNDSYLCSASKPEGTMLTLRTGKESEELSLIYGFESVLMNISPNQQYVALFDPYLSQTTNVYLFNLYDNSMEKITFEGWVETVKWAADSSSIFYNRRDIDASDQKSLYRYELNSKTNTYLGEFNIHLFAFVNSSNAFIAIRKGHDSSEDNPLSLIKMAQETYTEEIKGYVESLDLVLEQNDVSLYSWQIDDKTYQKLFTVLDDTPNYIENLAFISPDTLRLTLVTPSLFIGGDSPELTEKQYYDIQY